MIQGDLKPTHSRIMTRFFTTMSKYFCNLETLEHAWYTTFTVCISFFTLGSVDKIMPRYKVVSCVVVSIYSITLHPFHGSVCVGCLCLLSVFMYAGTMSCLMAVSAATMSNHTQALATWYVKQILSAGITLIQRDGAG
jgi:uncharacterized membrane protein